jgi:hypothetical protein
MSHARPRPEELPDADADDLAALLGTPAASETAETRERPVLRDPATGRLLPGSRTINPKGRPPGSGARPRLIDLARSMADSRGVDLDDAIEAVVMAMLVKAGKGDVDAARLVLGRLAVDEHEPGRLQLVEAGPQMPEGRAMVDYIRGLATTYRDDARLAAERGDGPASRHHKAKAAMWEAQAVVYELSVDADEKRAAEPPARGA